MQLNDKSGIGCDLCGTAYQKDFSYYSTDAHAIDVYNSRKPTLYDLLHSKIVRSFDICPSCFDSKIKHKLVEAFKLATPTNVVCELSCRVLTGTYKYYYMVMTDVVVKTGTLYTCSKCGKQSNDKKQCACGSTSLARISNVTANERFCEFGVSSEEYDKLVQIADNIKSNAGQWGSQSNV